MMNCWLLDPQARPNFKNLASVFSDILEREACYLDLCPQSLCLRETSPDLPPSSPSYGGLPVLVEQHPPSADHTADEGL